MTKYKLIRFAGKLCDEYKQSFINFLVFIAFFFLMGLMVWVVFIWPMLFLVYLFVFVLSFVVDPLINTINTLVDLWKNS